MYYSMFGISISGCDFATDAVPLMFGFLSCTILLKKNGHERLRISQPKKCWENIACMKTFV